MENTTLCSMDKYLCKIISSSTSNNQTSQVLCMLDKIVANLLCSSSDKRYTILDKNVPILSTHLLQIDGVHEFLLFIGYRQENEVYFHETCDETIKILEDARKLVCCHMTYYYKHDDSLQLNHNQQQEEKENLMNENIVLDSDCMFRKWKKKEVRPCKIKQFLMKHLSKDEAGSLPCKYQPPKVSSPQISFNSEGYFHQSCKDRETIRKRDPRRELFDQHEQGAQKDKRCFFSFLRKK